MEMFVNALLGDLVNRSMSFLFAKCEKQATPDAEEFLQRLHHLLLRSSTIVEEAQRRHVESRAMRRQLKVLMDETFRSYYVLDTIMCRSALKDYDDGGEEGEGEASHRALALSRLHPAKRLRRFMSSSEPFVGELGLMVRRLEVMIGDMREFVVFMMSYPPMYRPPYNAHLSVGKCMFGRHMETEMVMEFLLVGKNLGVLPIIGPTHIGKTTLVEHVCNDERVRSHFSMILFYSGNVLRKEETSSSSSSSCFRDKCVIKHQNSSDSEKRVLIVIEVLDDVDEETWEWFYSPERNMDTQGSRIIITSRSNSIARFGTTEALTLQCLSLEATWYFFKMLTFGSDDPRQHPKMESIAMEITDVLRGSFMSVWMAAVLLRAYFNTQIWSRILTRLRQYIQKNTSLIGEYMDDIRSKDYRRYSWSLVKPKPNKYFMLDDIYHINPAAEADTEVPRITMFDLMSGCAAPQGKCEILYWKSPIPPYYKYVCACEIIGI